MRKTLTVLFVLAVLALNWAALHDIIKGEPDPRLEWAIVGVSLLLLLAAVVRRFVPRRG